MNLFWTEGEPEWKWVNPDNPPHSCMGVKKAGAVVEALCVEWWIDHPEDRHLPWQNILYKVLRVSAIHGGYSMYLCSSGNGCLISDFAMIDRAELSHPFHG